MFDAIASVSSLPIGCKVALEYNLLACPYLKFVLPLVSVRDIYAKRLG